MADHLDLCDLTQMRKRPPRHEQRLHKLKPNVNDYKTHDGSLAHAIPNNHHAEQLILTPSNFIDSPELQHTEITNPPIEHYLISILLVHLAASRLQDISSSHDNVVLGALHLHFSWNENAFDLAISALSSSIGRRSTGGQEHFS